MKIAKRIQDYGSINYVNGGDETIPAGGIVVEGELVGYAVRPIEPGATGALDVGPCEPVYAPVCGPVGEGVAAQTIVVVQAPRPPKLTKREVVRNWEVARTRRVLFNERKIERRRVEKVRVRSGGVDVRVDSGCASVGCKVGF